MCEYCEEVATQRGKKRFVRAYRRHEGWMNEGFLKQYHTGEWELFSFAGEDEGRTEWGTMYVQYCPWCGRKLCEKEPSGLEKRVILLEAVAQRLLKDFYQADYDNIKEQADQIMESLNEPSRPNS